MTDHFWTFGGRVDGQEGGELMKPLTIVKGTSDDTLKNILREMIEAGLNLEEQLEVNTGFVPAKGDRWKHDKRPKIALDQCPPRSGKNWPPYKWLAHFIHWYPIPQKISRNIKVIDCRPRTRWGRPERGAGGVHGASPNRPAANLSCGQPAILVGS